MSEIDRLAWLMREKSEMTDCPLTHEMCIPLVRCVLEGMLHPSDAMIVQGMDGGDGNYIAAYRSMINEALK